MPPKKRLADEAVARLLAVDRRRGGLARDEDQSGPRRTGTTAAPRHWAFEPVKAVAPPPDPTGWSERPIDRFIAARRRAAGLQPVRRADRRTLIRRVTFDLIGLPPDAGGSRRIPRRSRARTRSPGSSTDCSPRRITASAGAGTGWTSPTMPTPPATTPTIPIPEVARYRDYIIDAFNRDKPYRRSSSASNWPATSWRAARRAPDYAERSSATGFLALSRRYATGPVRALAPDARRRDRDDRPRLPRARRSAAPAATTTSSTRSPSATTTPSTACSPARASLRRLRGIAVEGLPAAELRPAGRAGAGRAEAEGLSRTARRARSAIIAALESTKDAAARAHARRTEAPSWPGSSGRRCRRTCRAPTP